MWKNILKPNSSISVHIGRKTIEINYFHTRKNIIQTVVTEGKELFVNNLGTEVNAHNIEVLLDDAINRLADKCRIKGNPISFSIPDPCIKWLFIYLDEIPDRKKEKHALIKWHFEKYYDLDQDNFAYSYVHQGKKFGKNIMVAAAVDIKLIKILENIGTRHGLLVSDINSDFMYQIDHTLNAIDNKNIAIIHYVNDCWTLGIIDSDKILIGIYSSWNRDGIDDASLMINEVEGYIRAHSYKNNPIKIDDIYLCGSNRLINGVKMQLNDRLRKKCIVLPKPASNYQ